MNARVMLIEARKQLEAAVRIRPEHPRYLELLGAACLVSGDVLAAVQHLEHAMKKERTVRATWLLGWALVHAGRIADVERIVRELFEEGRGCPRALYVRALARFKRKAFDLAIEDLREAMPDEVDVPFFRIELARVLIAAALGAGSPAAPVKPGGPSHPRALMLREATDLLRSGHVDDPGSIDERNYLTGCAYLELGEWTRALSVLAETDYPSHGEAAFRRAVAAAREGDSETASNGFEVASDDPDLEHVSEAAITALATTGSLGGVAIPPPSIAPLGVGPPGDPPAVRLIVPGDRWPAAPTGKRGSLPAPPASGPKPATRPPAEAVERLSKALAADDIDFVAASDCVSAVEEGASLSGGLRDRMMHALATALHVDLRTLEEDVAAIIPLLERLRRAVPALAFARLYLARACYRRNDWARAIVELTGIDGELSEHVVVHNLLGRCQEKLGHFQDAAHSFEDSLAQRPDQGTVRYSLGRLMLARYRQSCEPPPVASSA